jgi:hypothetical protein
MPMVTQTHRLGRVLASVIVDQSGALYELDLWKVDSSPLKGIPNPDQLLLDPPMRRIST